MDFFGPARSEPAGYVPSFSLDVRPFVGSLHAVHVISSEGHSTKVT